MPQRVRLERSSGAEECHSFISADVEEHCESTVGLGARCGEELDARRGHPIVSSVEVVDAHRFSRPSFVRDGESRRCLWLPGRVPGSRWTSFVADPERRRILHEDGNEAHRLRVEHDRTRLYVELSGEDGAGPWTVLAVDRASRHYAVAQADTKTAATEAAAHSFTELLAR